MRRVLTYVTALLLIIGLSIIAPSPGLPNYSTISNFGFVDYTQLFGSSLRGHVLNRSDPFLDSQAVPNLIEEAGVKVIRFIYDADEVYSQEKATIADIVQKVESIGAEVMIGLPITSSYCKGEDPTTISVNIATDFPSVRLFELGNEPVPMDPYVYAGIYRNTVVASRQARASKGYSKAYYGGPVVGSIDSKEYPDHWEMISVLLQENSDIMHADDSFISGHYYTSYSWREIVNGGVTKEQMRVRATEEYKQHLSNLKSLSKEILGYELPIAITEWNFHCNLGKLNEQGIYWELDEDFIIPWTKNAMNSMREGGAWISLQWNIAGMLDSNGNPKPQYYGFKEGSTT